MHCRKLREFPPPVDRSQPIESIFTSAVCISIRDLLEHTKTMTMMKTLCIGALALFLALNARNVNAWQSTGPNQSEDKKSTTGQGMPSADGHKEGPNNSPDSAETAAKFRRRIPVVPGLLRGEDGLLSTEGQRAVQNQHVTGTNVKDPVTDTYPFTWGLPVEAVEPVLIPAEQFVVLQMKFNATVPVLDPISTSGWHFSAGVPFLSLREDSGAIHGIRSAAPAVSGSGPVWGDRAYLFESFEHRLSRTALDSLPAGSNLTEFRSFDWNNHLDFKLGRGHQLTARLSLFSQAVDFAGLSDLVPQQSTPDYYMAGGYAFFSDTYETSRGTIVDSSVGGRLVHLHVFSRGITPMTVVEQGDTTGSYFDTLHRSSSRTEWRENITLGEHLAAGTHRISFGGGVARAAFDSVDAGGEIRITRDDPDQLFYTVSFAGPPIESLSSWEGAGWIQDVWTPKPRASFTMGLRYDRTGVSRTNEWGPRVGFALLPFKDDHTVVRGGFGIFYDMLALTAGSFEQSERRVVQLWNNNLPLGDPRVLQNVLSADHLHSPHIIGWNFEVDHQFKLPLLLRIRAEERLGRSLTLLDPNSLAALATKFILSDKGTSRFREVEATATYRLRKTSSVNVAYVRSSSNGDLNTFTGLTGTFERSVINLDRYSFSRSDSPNRFLAWGEVDLPGGLQLSPVLDVHTGFPYGFFDASNDIPGTPFLGRFPAAASLDLGLFRDVGVKKLLEGRARVGFKVYNVTNHFNPREVKLAENDDGPVFVGFLNPVGRSYRASFVLSF
jgi:hypothetical protein